MFRVVEVSVHGHLALVLWACLRWGIVGQGVAEHRAHLTVFRMQGERASGWGPTPPSRTSPRDLTPSHCPSTKSPLRAPQL